MEVFTDANGWALLFRWVHILAGITWIGLLYYFNFIQAPFFAEIEADVRTTAIRKLVPRALWWFRYAALVTWLAGVAIVLVRISQDAFGFNPYSVQIITGITLGTIMFLNVWGVIWPKQKIVIGSAESVAAGGAPNPGATDAGRRALLASRTNVVFSVAMVFFMATASHLFLFDQGASTGGIWAYYILGAAIVGAVEANALIGLTGQTKKPLERVDTSIWASIGLLIVLYVVLQVLTA